MKITKGSARAVLGSTLVVLCWDAAGTIESRDHAAVRLIVSYISLRRRCVLHPFRGFDFKEGHLIAGQEE